VLSVAQVRSNTAYMTHYHSGRRQHHHRTAATATAPRLDMTRDNQSVCVYAILRPRGTSVLTFDYVNCSLFIITVYFTLFFAIAIDISCSSINSVV